MEYGCIPKFLHEGQTPFSIYSETSLSVSLQGVVPEHYRLLQELHLHMELNQMTDVELLYLFRMEIFIPPCSIHILHVTCVPILTVAIWLSLTNVCCRSSQRVTYTVGFS